MTELTVHTMPLDVLRARASEAQRLIARAREIAYRSFDLRGDADGAQGAQGAQDTDDDASRVGQLLDAAQRLLPGIPSLVEDRPFPSRPARAKPPELGWRRVTLRGGADRALEAIERARILDEVAHDAAGLVAEIERRSSSVFRAADVAPLAAGNEEKG
jgi:hypothetical protein